MYRVVWTLVVLTVSAFEAAPPPAAISRRDIDATTFVLAFRAGRADAYKNKQISGAGTSFHGGVAERIADGSTRTSLVITLGSVTADDKVMPLNSFDEFVAAERAHTTLVVALSGPNLPPPPTNGPTLYEFSGVYDGQVRTVARAPASADMSGRQGVTPDAGPCPGETPRDASPSDNFYCAPLLTGATATIKR